MDDATTPDLGGLVTRTLAIDVRSAGTDGPSFDDQGRQIYTALAYAYDEVDTYGTTLASGAMSHVTAEDFRILEYHRADRDPVGKPVSVEETDAGPVVRFVFADTDRAKELRHLVDGGFLRAVSVGFIPTDGYVRADGVTVFTRADLHELSLVNTPASKGALIELARDLGTDPEDLAGLFGELPDTLEVEDAEPVAVRHEIDVPEVGTIVLDFIGDEVRFIEIRACEACECETQTDDDASAEEAATVTDVSNRILRALSLVRRHRR
jgi:HK97 family phage prohead protease